MSTTAKKFQMATRADLVAHRKVVARTEFIVRALEHQAPAHPEGAFIYFMLAENLGSQCAHALTEKSQYEVSRLESVATASEQLAEWLVEYGTSDFTYEQYRNEISSAINTGIFNFNLWDSLGPNYED